MDFLPFSDVERSVHDDVALLRASPLIQDVPIHGYVYEVATGRLRQVTPAAEPPASTSV